jgi:ABC-2 type transport system permease protein
MNWGQMTIVARKEIREITTSRGTVISTVFFALWFGVINAQSVNGSTSSEMLSVQLFYMAPMLGALMGYLLTGTVFSREKQDGVIETLLCTPLDLRTIWLGKLIGVSVIAYVASLISTVLLIVVAGFLANSLLIPSLIIVLHIALTVPMFTMAVVGLIGYSQLLLGMKENTVIGVFTFLGLFLGLSIVGQLITGSGQVTLAMVGMMLSVAGGLLVLTFYLARYLSKEKVVTTIP